MSSVYRTPAERTEVKPVTFAEKMRALAQSFNPRLTDMDVSRSLEYVQRTVKEAAEQGKYNTEICLYYTNNNKPEVLTSEIAGMLKHEIEVQLALKVEEYEASWMKISWQ